MELKFLKFGKEKHPTKNTDLEYLEKHNAVALMLFNYDYTKTLLVNQYRPGAKKNIYEIPAGILEKGENPLEGALREIEEETGYPSSELTDIKSYEKALYISPGYTTEKLYIYIARLKSENPLNIGMKLDDGEDIFTEWIDLDNLMEVTEDFKTIFAYYFYKNGK